MDESAVPVAMEGLQVGYGTPVCPPVTVSVLPGDIVALVGANGCGKSTLLRTAAGLLQPLSGQLTIFGAPVDERRQAFRALVATELGDEAFFPALTVREHMLLTCHGHAVDTPELVVDRLLARFGLAERAEALPAALSSGQRRRLLLASVFARPRRLLLLDEPEQRLDVAMREAMGERLVEERGAGRAVLLATHDPDLVRRAATTVVAISDDRIRVLDAVEGSEMLRRTL
jgi:ABC-type multidrug transport system ATPase subunit